MTLLIQVGTEKGLPSFNTTLTTASLTEWCSRSASSSGRRTYASHEPRESLQVILIRNTLTQSFQLSSLTLQKPGTLPPTLYTPLEELLSDSHTQPRRASSPPSPPLCQQPPCQVNPETGLGLFEVSESLILTLSFSMSFSLFDLTLLWALARLAEPL